MISNFRNHLHTVLLVVANEQVRDTFYRALVCDGYNVQTAADAREAMRALQTPEPALPIDLVVLDVNLPDVNGLDLCARMRQVFPTLPRLIFTGVAEPGDIVQLLQLSGIRRWYPKPSVNEIRAGVGASLAEKRSEGKALRVAPQVHKARTSRVPARRQLRLPLRRRLKAPPSNN